ncbi:HmuY family protein [Pedobacter faecalis]|uniref:HmuY family protein n=1 Tax=Pedobacter faecalis TaxID=3041495 RepID=UPI00254E1080|nr:HmuY family protein [Pedobacter sp. ELA7]
MKISNAFYCWLMMGLLSCSKGDDPAPEKELPPLPAATVTASGEYTATLIGDTEASMSTGDGVFKPVYYSLEDGRPVPEAYAATDKWDIAFTSIYNSSMWANHGEVAFENGTKGPGFGSPARGGLYLIIDPSVEARYYDQEKHQPKQVPIDKSLLDEAYDNVKTVPVADNQLLSAGYLSLDHFLGSGNGYAFYDFYGAMFPGDKERAHIVYNLPRPIIVKTAKGNYAKLIIYSFYKGSPTSPTLQSEAPYITFKYTILKDGLKDFTKIK